MPNDAYRILNAVSIEMYKRSRTVQNNFKEQALYAGYQMALDDLFACIKDLTSQIEDEEKRLNEGFPVYINPYGRTNE